MGAVGTLPGISAVDSSLDWQHSWLMDNYKHQDPDDDGQLPWQQTVKDPIYTGEWVIPSRGKGLTKDDAPSQPVHAGLKPFAGELSTRWKKKKAQAAAAGFKSAWEMRKASHQAKHVGYTPTASAEPATPLLDRLSAGNGPVRVIMANGVRLID